MSPQMLILPMAAHVAWATFLYAALTLVRAPTAWGIFILRKTQFTPSKIMA